MKILTECRDAVFRHSLGAQTRKLPSSPSSSSATNAFTSDDEDLELTYLQRNRTRWASTVLSSSSTTAQQKRVEYVLNAFVRTGGSNEQQQLVMSPGLHERDDTHCPLHTPHFSPRCHFPFRAHDEAGTFEFLASVSSLSTAA